MFILVIASITANKSFAQQKDSLILKKTIAVAPLGVSASVGGYDSYGNTMDVSMDITDMLTTALVQTNKYQVIERDQIDKILKEQNGQTPNGTVITGSTLAPFHNIGAQLLIMGTVTECGVKTSNGVVVVGSVQGYHGVLTGRVAVDLRIVNVSSGEVIIADHAVAEQKAHAGEVDASVHGEPVKLGEGNGSDLTLIGKVKREAVMKCVKLITDAIMKVRWEGYVVKVNSTNDIFMKPGTVGGVKPGMQFDIYSKGEDVIDPQTGQSLGSKDVVIGQVKIVGDIGDGHACEAKVINVTPGQTVKIGDIIKAQ